MKLTIFNGREKPIVAIGKNQCNLLHFAHKYQTWHTFKLTDKATCNAIKRLKEKGYLEVIEDQFKFKGV